MPAPLHKCKIAVIGAGVAGLSCAKALQSAGADVTVFDKGRFVGGRLASRERPGSLFDYGAQFFTASTDRFAQIIEEWTEAGVAAEWQGNFGVARLSDKNGSDTSANNSPPHFDLTASLPPKKRFVGTPLMSMIGRYLSRDLPLLGLYRVTHLNYNQALSTFQLNGGIVHSAGEAGEEAEQFYRIGFEFVVLNMPPSQIIDLFNATVDATLRQRLIESAAFQQIQGVNLAPCFAVMVQFAQPLDFEANLDGISVKSDGRNALSWICRDTSKPNRPAGEHWILHASPQWSKHNLELDTESVTRHLLNELEVVIGKKLPSVIFVKCHRWRFALAENPLSVGALIDDQLGVGLCGDWCQGDNIEAAFLSGEKLAAEIMRWWQTKS